MGSVFPSGFTWGVATAAYQIEGHPLDDGATASSWHEFTHQRGRVKDDTNGDLACDHYRRWPEDIRNMRELGVKAYRFSIAWTRIFPEPDRENPKGMDFYSRLIDSLLDAGIEPWVTVFHLEEPLWLARAGGMASRASVDRLVEFAAAVMLRFGDRVKNWVTINEPTIYAFSGYVTGEFPPGRRNDLRGMLHSAHHLLLAHSRMCAFFPSIVSGGRIGLAHHFVWVDPARAHVEKDSEAAAFMDEAANGSVLDPILFGRYPGSVMKKLGRFLPGGFEKDLGEMGKPGGYVGINYYTRSRYRHSRLIPFLHAVEHVDRGSPRSAMWEIHPQGLFKALMRLKDRYGNPPCYITENGFPLPEEGLADPLSDERRIAYLSDHVAMVGKAIEGGADCRGYFCWSLLDNFEWNLGLSMRFGLIRTDFTTMERQWKRSAYWYRDLIRAKGLPPEP